MGMNQHELLKECSLKNDKKILFCVVDGLGGIQKDGKTELEVARTPNMDQLAKDGSCGLHIPVIPGIAPGSGPAHLALFGYDPLQFLVGRGILAALGGGLDVREGDVCARVNFCTVDEQGVVTDRRAGRIPTEKGEQLCATILSKLPPIPGVELQLKAIKQYRAALVLRGAGLGDALNDSDPMKPGLPHLEITGRDAASEKTARILQEFVRHVREILKEESPANMISLRGFGIHKPYPRFQELYKLTPAAIAAYPAYKGVARLVGMDVLDCGKTFDEEIACLQNNWEHYDFHFIHYKDPDAAGEDGNFEKRVELFEYFDSKLPTLRALNPDVLIVTGDHCTPAVCSDHSGHSVPLVICGGLQRNDSVQTFTEEALLRGSLGIMQSEHILTMAMAHAGKLKRFGP
ncbi:MAG: 2,3-bisphosphoglycerate-independent phosphoglycerate mutase [Candidatus Woesearchaeota archaeon]|nr:2,3-bisphosphoglycerate-independent phosphoglycerate mutase [Candidatus Woesearchaeota archaeon]